MKHMYLSTTSTISQPLNRAPCVSWHDQLRTGRCFWSKVLLPACFCPCSTWIRNISDYHSSFNMEL